MTLYAIHNSRGDIDAIVKSSEGAPPPEAVDTEQFVTEIELPQGEDFDLTSPEAEQRATEWLKGFRIQSAMIRRS